VKFHGHAATKVARLLLDGGPATAASIALTLQMTSTAIRKQLDILLESEFVEAHERAPFGPADNSPRGRGRPAKVFAITPAGRGFFEQPYDDIAIDAIRFIAQNHGASAVRAFAKQRAEALVNGLKIDGHLSAQQLANGLAEQGFSSSLRAAPMGDAVQLCQHNCPIGHVASEFPQFCEAEAEAIGTALGVNVTRLSTIASGSAICTTHIPTPTPRRSA